MAEPFLIALRESFQCSLILAALLLYPPVGRNAVRFRALLSGTLCAFIAGFLLGYSPDLNKRLLGAETWTFWRHISDSFIYYLGVLAAIAPPRASKRTTLCLLFILGFVTYFFESRELGFIIQDMGVMKESRFAVSAMGLLGTASGLMPVLLLRKRLAGLPLDDAFTLPSLLVFIGALRFGMSGLGELNRGNIISSVNNGLMVFLAEAAAHVQHMLMIERHPFINVPLSGLIAFMSGDRMALSLVVVLLMLPPLLILSGLTGRPDPSVSDIALGSQRRQAIAFFRKELVFRTVPVLTAFMLLVILLHAVNTSLNPLYEPVPTPIRETEGEAILKIPMAGLSDNKLRKYVYYQILFLVISKPDGSVGVALDQCEICRPAEWNKEAQGYAQRGDHLICKYCMTPIAVPTLNNPGGCNPIPVPFRQGESHITISVQDLVGTYKAAEALDKKGTHL